MTRSTSSLGLSRNNRKPTKPLKSSIISATSSRCQSPKPLKSPTISLYNLTPIDRDLNDILRNLVDELCDFFVKARQDGKNEAQTVDVIVNFSTSKNQDLSQIFDWLLNNTHKDKYKTLLGYFYDQVAKRRVQSLLNLIAHHPNVEDSLLSKGVDMNLLNNQFGELK
ncbi:4122_t:CDS:2 [Dentiscutata heterogama]|uniref:4122_t:CDS:1 n=1 Tax=Dentiscutata heterogama TaxID=1316150 RepID=A0ACA9KGE8_9GLOM|nr:4122_t:CDS:2 [Dentiscutata heterogama]